MEIMSMNELVAFLREQSGLTIMTPQFERTDGVVPVQPEGGAAWFDQLKRLPHETLKAIGMGCWEKGRYLYPQEWYGFIPEGYPVTDIFGEDVPFKRGESSNDIRFGMLAYGFRTDEWEPDPEDVLRESIAVAAD